MRKIILVPLMILFFGSTLLANPGQGFKDYSCTLYLEKNGERISNKDASFKAGHDAGAVIELGNARATISYTEEFLILGVDDSEFVPKLYTYSHASLEEKAPQLHVGDGNFNGYTLECFGQ